MKFLIRIYTCDIPLNFFHKILRVLSSVRHFFSVARDTPLTLFQKILRVLSSVRHFFSVARHTIIVCKLSLKEGEDNMTWSPRLSFLGTKLLNTQISRLPLINTEDRSQLCGNFLTNFRGGPLTKSLNRKIVSIARDTTS